MAINFLFHHSSILVRNHLHSGAYGTGRVGFAIASVQGWGVWGYRVFRLSEKLVCDNNVLAFDSAGRQKLLVDVRATAITFFEES